MTRAHVPDEASLSRMVHRFYEQVRDDPTLGPIFERHVDGRWPEHLDKMVDFWTTVLLGARRYQGNPRATHAALAGEIGPEAFDVWLDLFRGTVHEVFAPELANAIHRRATMMASGLKQAAFGRRPPLPVTG